MHCIHRQDLSTAYAFPSSMVCYKSVTHSERSDVLSVRLRISHTYGCLSQDLCLDCCTSNLSISWRERWWFGVHEASSTKWESQQHGNNNLKKTNRKHNDYKNIWLFVSCEYMVYLVQRWCQVLYPVKVLFWFLSRPVYRHNNMMFIFETDPSKKQIKSSPYQFEIKLKWVSHVDLRVTFVC